MVVCAAPGEARRMATHVLDVGRGRGRFGARTEVVLADDGSAGRGAARSALEREPHVVVVAETERLIDLAGLATGLAPRVIVLLTARRDAAIGSAIGTVRRAHPATDVVLVSPHTDEPSVRAGLEAGARGYLGHDDLDIGRAVRAVASGGAYFSPQVANVVRCGYLRRSGLALDAMLSRLSDADRRVLGSLVRGRASAEIEADLGWSARDLLASRRRIVQALAVDGRVDHAPRRAGAAELGH
jgi:DNA-binding NarL/FixJ family response regulator